MRVGVYSEQPLTKILPNTKTSANITSNVTRLTYVLSDGAA